MLVQRQARGDEMGPKTASQSSPLRGPVDDSPGIIGQFVGKLAGLESGGIDHGRVSSVPSQSGDALRIGRKNDDPLLEADLCHPDRLDEVAVVGYHYRCVVAVLGSIEDQMRGDIDVAALLFGDQRPDKSGRNTTMGKRCSFGASLTRFWLTT